MAAAGMTEYEMVLFEEADDVIERPVHESMRHELDRQRHPAERIDLVRRRDRFVMFQCLPELFVFRIGSLVKDGFRSQAAYLALLQGFKVAHNGFTETDHGKLGGIGFYDNIEFQADAIPRIILLEDDVADGPFLHGISHGFHTIT